LGFGFAGTAAGSAGVAAGWDGAGVMTLTG